MAGARGEDGRALRSGWGATVIACPARGVTATHGVQRACPLALALAVVGLGLLAGAKVAQSLPALAAMRPVAATIPLAGTERVEINSADCDLIGLLLLSLVAAHQAAGQRVGAGVVVEPIDLADIDAP